MKRLPLLALLMALSLSLPMHDAEAKRFGGGMSSGMKRGSSITQRSATPTPSPAPSQATAPRPAQASPAPTPAPQPSGMRRWLGPLAGLAAGIGLAALFSHLGMGAEMGSFLMLLLAGGAIFLVIRLLMNRNAPQAQPAGAGSYGGNVQRFEPTAAPVTTATPPLSEGAASIPADFDADGFLRQAKLNFVRLQAANDAGNMEDIRSFVTPEMFAEVQLQYQERGRTQQQTDVVQLNAALLDVSNEAARQIASVHFSGSIRESADAAPEAFDEVWHLTRPLDGSSGWIIAGIQQFH